MQQLPVGCTSFNDVLKVHFNDEAAQWCSGQWKVLFMIYSMFYDVWFSPSSVKMFLGNLENVSFIYPITFPKRISLLQRHDDVSSLEIQSKYHVDRAPAKTERLSLNTRHSQPTVHSVCSRKIKRKCPRTSCYNFILTLLININVYFQKRTWALNMAKDYCMYSDGLQRKFAHTMCMKFCHVLVTK